MFDRFNKQLEKFKISLSQVEKDKLNIYCDALIETNAKYNLVGKLDKETIYVDHIADSLSFSLLDRNNYFNKEEYKLIDLGSGAGFPAIPIAITNPSIDVTMVESIKKKATFLNEVNSLLADVNLTVVSDRIEVIAHYPEHREKYDIVTARALSDLSELLEYSMPLLKIGGIFIAYKTEKALEELKEVSKIANRLGGMLENKVEYHLTGKDLKRYLLIYKKISVTPDKYPGKSGLHFKKSLKTRII